MAGKRKRKPHGHENGGNQKRHRLSSYSNLKDPVIKQAILTQYYPQVLSLREYLLFKLPNTSKIRRKKINSVGKRHDEGEQAFADFLDQTLIGVSKFQDVSQEERLKQWVTFSQRADLSTSTFANTSSTGIYSQSEIVDFAIWLLFSKSQVSTGRVQHLLCQGFRKDVISRAVREEDTGRSAIPGVVSVYPNSHVTSMKLTPWPQVLGLMGKEGERAMIDLVLDCGIFLPVKSARGSFHQLSGHPLGDLQIFPDSTDQTPNSSSKHSPKAISIHTPSSIIFVRNRMMYARAALNAQGEVRFGLRHIHVLNRYQMSPLPETPETSNPTPHPSTAHVMMYIFPRQFGLHNVFTNEVDSRQTVQPFKDYTLREEEINKKYPSTITTKIPKRLRGKTMELVRKLQIRHSRCPYKKLLEHYCPAIPSPSPDKTSTLEVQDTVEESTAFQTQISKRAGHSIELATTITPKIPPRKQYMMDHATPTLMVSSFCQAVLAKLIPPEFWGTADVAHNEQIFYRNVDSFIQLRRFEGFSLHEVSQGIRISNMDWLGPSSTIAKFSKSDLNKRLEIFLEFLYYLFDSLLIPLIRANFHVTESNVHRYRLFFFRHDVWKSISEPALASLKLNMFEEIKLEHARKILDSRTLGFSQVRLLPKESGVRPIMNLRRRTIKKGYQDVLGSSINSVLAPVYNVLTFEKTLDPRRLGSTLFSVGDLYKNLKTFKSKLLSQALYFVKVDVQSAFDTIPQAAVVRLMSSLPSESEYRISRHVEIKPGDNYREDAEIHNLVKPIRKWTALAKAPDDFQSFEEELESELAVGRKSTIFIETVVNQFRDTDDLMNLLAEHVQRNMVKIGKKFYRQKEGIPQGSVLSSLLCNYFYADLEAHHLSFLQDESSLLLRLIDDFLLITTDRSHAKQFLQIMHDGLPAYGVRVNPDKTLTNFEAFINGKKISRLVGSDGFPYCGSFINTKTLDISRDRERRKDMAIADSLTVEFSRTPGKTFHRKILNTFKIQSHAMFLDTSFNSLTTVLSNIYTAFTETATKMWTYVRCLPVGKQPGTKLIIKTVEDLIELAFVLMKGKSKSRKNEGYKCDISKARVEWLAFNAFRGVLRKRQSKYGKIIEWLDVKIKALEVKEKGICERMKGAMRGGVD